MCGVFRLQDRSFEIDCMLVDPDWWRHPDPPIDLTRIRFETDGPVAVGPAAWKVELTTIGAMMANVAHLRDGQLADRLGGVLAETGNQIAAAAGADVGFDWTAHDSGKQQMPG